jgi:hypothetical protein
MSRWRIVLEARDALLAVITPALRLQKFIQRGPAIARSLRVIRPNRPMQMSRLENIFKNY